MADKCSTKRKTPGCNQGSEVKPNHQLKEIDNMTIGQGTDNAPQLHADLADSDISNVIVDDPDTGDVTIEFGELTDSLGSVVRVRTYLYPECNEGAFVSMDAGGCEAATFRADEAEQVGKWLMLAAQYARSLSTKAASQ